MRSRVNLGLVIGIAGIITYYSVKPLPTGPYDPSGANLTYLYHVAAYLVLAAALLLYFHDTPKGHIEAVVAASLFGAVIEVVQYGVPGRHFTLIDIGLNIFGASLVLLDHRISVVTRIIELEDRILTRILYRA